MQKRDWLRALEPVVQEHNKWVQGGCQPEHGDDLVGAVANLVEFGREANTEGGFVPLDVGPLAARLDSVSGDAWPPPAADPFWRHIDAAEDAFIRLKYPVPRRPESVARLMAEKVPLHTICDIWGLTTPGGGPDLERLSLEVEKPGTQIPADYLPPLQQRQKRELDQRLAAARQTQQRRTALLSRSPTAPETVLQLARQGVAATQIASMKGLSIESVLAECKAAGVTVKRDYSVDVNALSTFTGSGPELPIEESASEFGDEAEGGESPEEGDLTEPTTQSVDDQVVAMFERGMSQVDIAAATGLPKRRVQTILREANAHPPAAASAG